MAGGPRRVGLVGVTLLGAFLCSFLVVPRAGAAASAADSMVAWDAGVGRWTENVGCLEDPTQTYALYLPSHFDAAHPCATLLIFDPRGRSRPAGALFERAAEEFGWILISSNDTRSDTSWDPNARALQALWPEVHRRTGIDARRLYAAGFSGGVIVAWYLAQLAEPPTLAGILSAGGRPADEIPTQRIDFAHFGTAGVFDFNVLPMKELDRIAARRHADHQLQFFLGRHQWMPEPLAYEGVAWMEVLAMRDGLRPRDALFLERTYQRRVARADSLLAAGEDLEALRQVEVVVRSWQGQRDLRALTKRRDRLRSSAAVRSQRQEEHAADRWEAATQQAFLPLLGALEAGTNTRSAADLIDELGLADIRARAAVRSRKGDAAQRILEWSFTRTSFYIHRKLRAQGNPRQAAVSLEVATFIHPHVPLVWYNLACAQALAENPEQANRALTRALDAGFDNLPHLQNDTDLQGIRHTSAYRAAVQRLQTSAHTP